jgi:exonuclease SbcC
MLITRLRLVNFRQHEDTDLLLGPGLTGIVGPNGAGKTTLLEAIAFVMYGMPAARGNKDSVRRRGAPPRSVMEVEMEFDLGAHRHRVVRGLTRADLYLDGQAEPIATGLDGVTDRVERLLGMTRDEFFNTYFTGQKELAVMAEMKPVERARFLSRVLGHEKLATAQERNRIHRNELATRAATLRATLPDPATITIAEQEASTRLHRAKLAAEDARRQLGQSRTALGMVRPEVERLTAVRDRASRLDGDLRVALAARLTAEADVGRHAAQLASAAAAVTRAAELDVEIQPLAALRQEEQGLARAAEGARDRDLLVLTHADAVARRAVLLEEIGRLPAAETLAQLVERGKQLRTESLHAEKVAADLRLAWANDRQEAETKRQALLDQYRDLDQQFRQVDASGGEGPCPTCGKPLGEGRAPLLAMLGDKMEEVKLNGTFYARRIEQLAAEPDELTQADLRRVDVAQQLEDARRTHALMLADARRGDDLRTQLEQVTTSLADLDERVAAVPLAYDGGRHAALQRDVTRLEDLARERERVAVTAGQRAAAEAALAGAKAAHDAALAAVAALEVERQALGFDAEAFSRAQAALQQADAEERAAQLALVAAEADCSAGVAAVAQAGAAREAYAERQRQVREAELDHLLRNELDRAFTDLRTDLNNDLRPELAELASGFLGDLTQGRYDDLELDEQYMATVVDDGEAKPVISGGEEDVVNLALRLAISQMIADRAGQPLSLLVLDEIFGSLDESRRAAVVELLRSLADRFPQVILITHIDTVREGFDRIVRVRYDGARRTAVVSDEPVEGRDVAA